MWNKFTQAYLYSSIHIALIAGLSYFCFTDTDYVFQRSIVVGVLTFSFYNLSRIFRISNYKQILKNEHLLFVSENLTEILIAIFSFSIISVLILFSQVGIFDINTTSLSICILIAFIYYYARKYYYLKNILVAVGWTTCFLLFEVNQFHFLKYLSFTVFIFFLSLWYDEKDTVIGEYKQYNTIKCLLLIVSSILFGMYTNMWNGILLFVLNGILILYSGEKRKDAYYLFWVDVMILIYAMMVYFFEKMV